MATTTGAPGSKMFSPTKMIAPVSLNSRELCLPIHDLATRELVFRSLCIPFLNLSPNYLIERTISILILRHIRKVILLDYISVYDI